VDTTTWRSSPSTSSSSHDPQRGADRGAPEAGHAQLEHELVVEARRALEGEAGLADHGVEAALGHLLPRPDRLSPQLREGDVEIEQVVRVEDDPLRVALPVAHPQRVLEDHVSKDATRRACNRCAKPLYTW
jgi:hypothetical protein